MLRDSKGRIVPGQFKYELSGQRFGLWVVLERSTPGCRNFTRWLCRCDCGTVRPAYQHQLLSGQSKNCGCENRKRSANQCRTHGLSDRPEHRVWIGIKSRCLNPRNAAYRHYGGRGIKICDRWAASFESFYEDMGPRPALGYSVERDDVNGDYEPGNCRWATQAEQNLNRRNNRRATCDGKTMTLKEWAEETGKPYETLMARWRYGWSDEDIVKRPVIQKSRRKRGPDGKYVHEQHQDGEAGDG